MTMKLAETSEGNSWLNDANPALQASWRDEIERAITNQKRTTWDKHFRRKWYMAVTQTKRRFREQTLSREEDRVGSDAGDRV